MFVLGRICCLDIQACFGIIKTAVDVVLNDADSLCKTGCLRLCKKTRGENRNKKKKNCVFHR